MKQKSLALINVNGERKTSTQKKLHLKKKTQTPRRVIFKFTNCEPK